MVIKPSSMVFNHGYGYQLWSSLCLESQTIFHYRYTVVIITMVMLCSIYNNFITNNQSFLLLWLFTNNFTTIYNYYYG